MQTVRLDVAQGLAGGDPQASFRDEVGPLYFEAADMLVRAADREEDATKARQLLARARDVLEALKEAEVDSYYEERCRPEEKSIRPIEPGTAVVYFLPLPDRTELLVDTAGGLRRVTLAVDASTLYTEARNLHSSSRRGPRTGTCTPPGGCTTGSSGRLKKSSACWRRAVRAEPTPATPPTPARSTRWCSCRTASC